jgi:hypothetical protein
MNQIKGANPLTDTGPSRLWYAAAVGLLAVAAGLFYFAVNRANERFTEAFANMQRVVMPGEHTLRLDQPGQYHVYYERRSKVDGRAFNTAEQPPNLQLSLSRTNGQSIEITDATELGFYDRGVYTGTGVWQFTIQQAGAYRLVGSYDEDAKRTPEIALAIDDGSLKSIYQQAMGLPLAVAGVLGVAALVMLAVAFAARLQAKARRLEAGGGG